jgi:hypothetical protein
MIQDFAYIYVFLEKKVFSCRNEIWLNVEIFVENAKFVQNLPSLVAVGVVLSGLKKII